MLEAARYVLRSSLTRNRVNNLRKLLGSHFACSCWALGASMMRRWKLHAEMTSECSRAASAAAHGAHGCCGMLFFLGCLQLNTSS